MSKISNNEIEIASLTVIGVIVLFVITIPITMYCNTKNETSAFTAIETVGQDAVVSSEIRSFLDGNKMPSDSWFLHIDDDNVGKILMTYAPIFEEKSGKPWDRELVYWGVYFEKVVKPLLKSKYVVIKD